MNEWYWARCKASGELSVIRCDCAGIWKVGSFAYSAREVYGQFEVLQRIHEPVEHSPSIDSVIEYLMSIILAKLNQADRHGVRDHYEDALTLCRMAKAR